MFILVLFLFLRILPFCVEMPTFAKMTKTITTMKYPIGIQSFDQLREDGYVYIDKTDLVYSLVTGGKIYFI